MEKIVEVVKYIENPVVIDVDKTIATTAMATTNIFSSNSFFEIIKNELGIDKKQEINAISTANLFLIMVYTLSRMEKLITGFRDVAFKKKNILDFTEAVKANLVNVNLNEEIEARFDESLWVISGVLAGVGSLGKNFAAYFKSRFSPESIKSLVNIEPSSFLRSEESRCWKKYSDIFSELSAEEIDRRLREFLFSYLQNLTKKRK